MNSKEYFNKIDEMLYHYFDLTLKKEIAGRSFDLYGFCRLDNERYVATRSVKIWEFIRVIRITEKTLLRLINSARAGLFFLCFILDI